MDAGGHSGRGGGRGGKRRRTAPPSGGSLTVISLTEDMLVAISEYLPKTSRALLAVALTAPSSSWRGRGRGWEGEPSAASKAIVSSVQPSDPFEELLGGLFSDIVAKYRPQLRGRLTYSARASSIEEIKFDLNNQMYNYYEGLPHPWTVLDFIDVEKSLACKLNDDDLGAILSVIGARHHLKRLNLTHCTGIVGHGLEPLRHSAVLEKIDMALVSQVEMPVSIEDALLAQDTVYPIIRDILNLEGNRFRRLQVPRNLCPESGPTEKLLQLLGDHRGVLNKTTLCCYFGAPPTETELRGSPDVTESCISCSQWDYLRQCSDCNVIHCDECSESNICNICRIGHCSDCQATTDNPVVHCESDDCGEPYCNECRINEHSNGNLDCWGCRDLAWNKLRETVETQREEMNLMQAVIDEQRGTINAKQAVIDAQRGTINAKQAIIDHQRETIDAKQAIIDAQRGYNEM